MSLQSMIPFIGQGLDAFMQGATNMQNRKFAREMYSRQRTDALSDWNMQNEYNNPANQMARLKAAGLNPNLVYGNGSAVQSSANVRSSEMSSGNAQAPKIDAGGALMQIYDVMKTMAENQNITARTALIQEQIKLTRNQTSHVGTQNQLSMQELGYRGHLNPISLQAAEQQVGKGKLEMRKIMMDTDFTENQMALNTLKNSADITEAFTRMAKMNMEMLKIPYDIKEVEARIRQVTMSAYGEYLNNKLRLEGKQPHDSPIMRKIQDLWNDVWSGWSKETRDKNVRKIGSYFKQRPY